MIQTMIQRWYKDDTKLMSFVYLARFFLLSMFFGGEMPSTHFLYHSLMFWITIDCVCDTRYKLICHFYNVESFCFLHCAAFQHYTVLFLSPECITFATTKTLRMKNITCILYLPPYLHDYIVNKYGVLRRKWPTIILIRASPRNTTPPSWHRNLHHTTRPSLQKAWVLSPFFSSVSCKACSMSCA